MPRFIASIYVNDRHGTSTKVVDVVKTIADANSSIGWRAITGPSGRVYLECADTLDGAGPLRADVRELIQILEARGVEVTTASVRELIRPDKRKVRLLLSDEQIDVTIRALQKQQTNQASSSMIAATVGVTTPETRSAIGNVIAQLQAARQ